MKRLILLTSLMGFLLAGSAQGQKYGDTPEDSIKCVTQFSLYYEDYKLWREKTGNDETFKVMVNSWRYVFFHCPQVSENVYIHGVVIFRDLIDREKNKDIQNKYIDTLMMVYDQRLKYYPEKKGDILCRKGMDLIKLRPSDYEKVFKILDEGISIEGNNSSAGSLYYYMVAAINLVKEGKADSSLIIDTYDKVSDIFDYNIKNNTKDAEAYSKILQTVEQISSDYLNCKDIIRIYTAKFNEQPNNLELVKKITKLLDKKECTNSDLFFKATEVRNKLEPSAYTAYLMASMYFKKEDNTKAAEYAKQAVDLYDEKDGKIRSYLILGECLKNLAQYAAAKAAASKIIELDPNNGRAYILLGDIYVAGAKTCGDNELTNKVAYWAAADKYSKAKNVDPDATVTAIASDKLSSISRYFPDKNTIFFYNLNEGDSYTVGCWINETTTVRASNP